MSEFLVLVKRSTRVAWWLALDVLMIAAALAIVFANYSGLVTAFALTGLDLTPLAENALAGSMFEALGAGEATQADLYAVGLALVMALGEVWVCHWLVHLISLWRGRREYGDEGEAVRRRFRGEAEWALVMLVLGALVLALPLWWDFELFRLRAVAGSLGLEYAEELWELPDWRVLAGDAAAPYAIRMAWLAPVGYVGLTTLAALCLEWAAGRTMDAFAAWEPALIALFAFDEAGEGDADRAAAAGVVPAAVSDGAGPRVSEEHPVAPERHTAGPVPLPDPVDVPAPAPTTPVVAEVPASEPERVEVVGSPGPERVTLAEALADPARYVADAAGRRVWARAFYDELHPETGNAEEAVRDAA